MSTVMAYVVMAYIVMAYMARPRQLRKHRYTTSDDSALHASHPCAPHPHAPAGPPTAVAMVLFANLKSARPPYI